MSFFDLCQALGHACAIGGVSSSGSGLRPELFLLQPVCVEFQNLTLRQDHAAAQHVLQFSDIARPVIGLQGLQVRLGNAHHSLVHFLIEAIQEILCEGYDILGAFPQRRYPNDEYFEPEIEVLPKQTFPDHGLKITVGGCDDAGLQGDRLDVAYSLEFSFLQNPQQLGLEIEREFADLIEKHRTAARKFQFAHLAMGSSRKSSFLVSEQFALQKVSDNGRTIDGDEGLIRGRLLVNCPSDKFLAGSGFAFDKNTRQRFATPARSL